MEEFRGTLISCIISRKGGVPFNELQDDYKNITGEKIPFKTLGFNTLESCLKDIKGITIKSGVVHASGSNTSHLEKLISKQKTKEKKKSKKKTIKNNKLRISPAFENTTKLNVKPKHVKRIYTGPIFTNNTKTINFQNFNCLAHDIFSHHWDSKWLDILRLNAINTKKPSKFFFCNHQIIGDNLMYNLIVDNLPKSDADYYSATCGGGITLRKAQFLVNENGCSERVLICCGSIEIHMGLPVDEIISDMQQLLLNIILSGGMPVVCNIPPSCFPWLNEKIGIFNHWLSTMRHIQIIDINSLFYHQYSRQVKRIMFDREPVHEYNVLYYLWSRFGQDTVQKAISEAFFKNY